MSIKLVAMGNTLMEDDGVGIEIAKQLDLCLQKKKIEVILGETDYSYCFSKIRETDDLIILDAVQEGNEPGKVSIYPLQEILKSSYCKYGYLQHTYNLYDMLKIYFPHIQGILITIEVAKVSLQYGLSSELTKQLQDITTDVLRSIEEYIVK